MRQRTQRYTSVNHNRRRAKKRRGFMLRLMCLLLFFAATTAVLVFLFTGFMDVLGLGTTPISLTELAARDCIGPIDAAYDAPNPPPIISEPNTGAEGPAALEALYTSLAAIHLRPPDGFEADNTALPWYLQLVNRYNFLDPYFEPPLDDIGSGHFFDTRAAARLHEMLAYAEGEGLRPLVISSYRSVARQRVLFDNQVQRRLEAGLTPQDAFEEARRVVAYPGSSEHNLGLAVDIVAYNYRSLTASFAQTSEGIWLAQNAHRFGFILRYPYHKQHITNIIYEPWHFRYVGEAHAAFMFENDLVLEELIYLMQNQ